MYGSRNRPSNVNIRCTAREIAPLMLTLSVRLEKIAPEFAPNIMLRGATLVCTCLKIQMASSLCVVPVMILSPRATEAIMCEPSLHVTKPTSVNMMAIITSSQGSPRRLLHTNANPCDGRCATEIDVLSPLWLRSDGRPEAPDNPQLGLHAATTE